MVNSLRLAIGVFFTCLFSATVIVPVCGCDGEAVEDGQDGALSPDSSLPADAESPDTRVEGGRDSGGDWGTDAGEDTGFADGGDDAGPGVSCVGDALEAGPFCARVSAMHCSWARRCTGYLPADCQNWVLQECTRMVDAIYQPLVEYGEWVYRSAAFDACEAAYSSGCPAAKPADCREMFTPCRARGETCVQMESYGWWDTVSYLLPFTNYFLLGDGCPDDDYCAVSSKAVTCGTCDALPREFERCGVWEECAAGMQCLGGYCVPLPGEGESCKSSGRCAAIETQCADDGAGDRVCTRRPGVGEPCTPFESPECYAAGLEAFCLDGACVKAPEEGEACVGLAPGYCMTGLKCESGTCVEPDPPTLVGKDETCGGTLVCGSDELVCAPVQEGSQDRVCKVIRKGYLGEDCNYWEKGCADGTYCGRLGGTDFCMKAAGEGEVCQGRPSDCDAATCANQGCPGNPVSRPCGPGLYCEQEYPPRDPCAQVLCIPYGSKPACSSNRECGPGMKCYDKTCIPEHEHPEFEGPVLNCGG
ncbi:MAG: hypothetical protein HY897_25580 [Deltaproteobacteria bacterium]|nr:hypothetical protein [Deltaproteobacteria bacterium]